MTFSLSDTNTLIIIALAVAFTLGIGLLVVWQLNKRKRRPIKMPYKPTADSLRMQLAIDVDSSLLTMPGFTEEKSKAHYIVIDTETMNAIESSEDKAEDFPYSSPISLTWQELDALGKPICEEMYILAQDLDKEPMKPEGYEIHGITEEQIRLGNDARDVYTTFINKLRRAEVVVAHNIAFHRYIIARDMRSLGLDDLASELEQKPSLCTMQWGKSLGFKTWQGGEALYPRLDELFGHLYFGRMHIPLRYARKPQRDVRLCAASLRAKITSEPN